MIESVEAAIHACKADVSLMHGNRDFLIGRDFASRANVSLLDDPTCITIGGEPVLLMHGDSLCTRDEAYMAIRSQLRDPAFQAQLLAQPINARRANRRQRQTRKHASQTANCDGNYGCHSKRGRSNYDESRSTHPYSRTHPSAHGSSKRGSTSDLRRIVLGDWGESGWHAVADGEGNLTLSSFAL